MAIYLEQGNLAPSLEKRSFSCSGVVVYELTSAANGTALTGTGDTLVVTSDAAGWLHVSSSANTDKAASKKTHRIQKDVARQIGGVNKGQWVSFLADA